MNNPYEQYKEQSLATMAPGEVLVKMFDELIKQCRIAIIAIGQKRFDTSNDALTKSQTILNTLATSLDMRYPISKQLKELYIFFAHQLLQANVRKNVRLIEQCIPLIKDLRDSFEQAEKISRMKQHTSMAGVGVGGRAV